MKLLQDECSPQWLRIALEEMRVFGHFDKVTELIGKLPDDVEQLILMVLRRIIDEDNDTQRVGLFSTKLYTSKPHKLHSKSRNSLV